MRSRVQHQFALHLLRRHIVVANVSKLWTQWSPFHYLSRPVILVGTVDASYTRMISCKRLVLSLLLAHIPQFAVSYSLLFKTEMNCSHLCLCRHNVLANTMKQYSIKHFAIMGETYRPELSYFDVKSEYMTFLGTFAPILHRIAEITCTISDGLNHSIMQLLNGADELMDIALDVRCQKGESLVWDIPSWQTSFNIFASENCNIVPPRKHTVVIIPMNMWIFDVEKGGHSTLDLIDVRYTMNTLTLAVMGSRSFTTPKQWNENYMLSAAVISLRDNNFEEFNCPFKFTKRLDTLNLEGNKLSHFPECVLHSANIQLNYLSLANNVITDLTLIYEVPESSEVPDIAIINLSFNQIRSIEAIRDMGNLVVLDLSHNAIRDITEDAFDHLVYLEVLYLSYNKIHVIGPYQFAKNVRLGIIDLSHNFLMTILPEQLPDAAHSLALDLRQNMLIYPPFRDCAKNKLKNLNLKLYSEGNPFFCDCHMTEFEDCQKWLDQNVSNQTKKQNIFMDIENMICAAPVETKDISLNDLSFHDRCVVIDDCPPTCSCILFNVEKLVINCSSRRHLEMPDIIPSYPNVSTILYLDHNPLQMLSHRPYLRSLSELHADNCLLTSVTPAAMVSLQDIRVLTLHNNLLQKLPSSTRNITLSRARNVTLHNNRWACTCDNLWLPRWITKHRSSLWMPGGIVCNYLRKPVEELSEGDLNCSSSSYIDTFLGISLVLSSVVSSLVIIFCYRSEISVLLYSKLGLRLDYTFSYGDFFNPYDAFVSYSQDNYRWVVDSFVPHLENGPKKYRLCLHYRDLSTGDSVVDNLPWAIRLSRCAILVLSKDVLRKEWSVMEVRAAFQRLVLVANKLAILATDDINIDELPPDLRDYMITHEYLRASDPSFWEKLEMYLPPKQATEELDQDPNNDKAGSGDSLMQSSPDKYEEGGISDLSELSFKPTETTDLEY